MLLMTPEVEPRPNNAEGRPQGARRSPSVLNVFALVLTDIAHPVHEEAIGYRQDPAG